MVNSEETSKIEHRVQTLETNHHSFIYELRRTNETLAKIEQAIERQNEIATDIRLLRQEVSAHIDMENESVKRQNARIEILESNQSRIAWIIVSTVLIALLTMVIKGN